MGVRMPSAPCMPVRVLVGPHVCVCTHTCINVCVPTCIKAHRHTMSAARMPVWLHDRANACTATPHATTRVPARRGVRTATHA